MNETTDQIKKRDQMVALIAPCAEKVAKFVKASILANELFDNLVASAAEPLTAALGAEEDSLLHDEIASGLYWLSSNLSCRYDAGPELDAACDSGVLDILMNLNEHNVSTK